MQPGRSWAKLPAVRSNPASPTTDPAGSRVPALPDSTAARQSSQATATTHTTHTAEPAEVTSIALLLHAERADKRQLLPDAASSPEPLQTHIVLHKAEQPKHMECMEVPELAPGQRARELQGTAGVLVLQEQASSGLKGLRGALGVGRAQCCRGRRKTPRHCCQSVLGENSFLTPKLAIGCSLRM